MKNPRIEMVLLLSAFAWTACSGEPEPAQEDAGEYVPPTLGERSLDPRGSLDDVGVADDLDLDAALPEIDASAPSAMDDFETCCTLTFALPDEDGVGDELYVQLVGSGSPLSDGLAMTFADGVWSVEACVPPDFVGTYSYVVGREVDGEVSEDVTINPFAPSENGVDNLWLTADSCDDASLDLHSLTSEP